MGRFEMIATATFGLEAVVARELRKLGFENIRTENARVYFEGNLKDLCRANLWLRAADRVLIKIGSFKAITFTELFDQTKALPWQDWLPENAEFPVEGKSINSILYSVSDCQRLVKKAIVEKMKETYQTDWFPEDGPKYKVEVSLLKDEVTLTIDTSGPGLHKRGYRTLGGEAPIKETLAAALIDLSFWKRDRVLLDPFCGSGTIPIEAAMIGMNMAPGLKRNFVAESWANIPAEIWQEARAEAEAAIDRDFELKIFGSDIDAKALKTARAHAEAAGVEDKVFFQKLPAQEARSRSKYGWVVTNPPYGERLGEKDVIEDLYRELQTAWQENLTTWSYYLLTSYPQFEKVFGRKADKRRKLYNGRLECQFYQFFGPKPPRKNTDV